jgi:predicted aldo/keto reductase-like oxidoreductase
MRHVRLGRTGLGVSRLCLGTMNFGQQTSEPDSFAIMDRALEAGINFFEAVVRISGESSRNVRTRTFAWPHPPRAARGLVVA